MASLRHLPAYAVGEASAEAAREAGFGHVVTGPADGAALVALMAAQGVRTAFHARGRETTEIDHPKVRLVSVPVYAAEAAEALPGAALRAIHEDALVLIHSPRAGAHFTALADAAGIERAAVRLAAISPAAARAAGGGWKLAAAATCPRDSALLELAAKLCKYGPAEGGE